MVYLKKNAKKPEKEKKRTLALSAIQCCLSRNEPAILRSEQKCLACQAKELGLLM